MNDMRQGVNAGVNAGLSMAPVRNVTLMTALVEKLINRDMNLPGMATFYGPSGFGKSTACAFAANMHKAYVIEMRSAYTAKHLCEKIALEMGLETRGTCAQLVDRVAEQMAMTGRPLIIDEADYAVKKRIIEVVRDLYEASQSPVILIGEERLPTKLEQWERVHGRMLDFVAAEPATIGDVRHLAKLYCANLSIGEELLAQVKAQSGPSIRRVVVNLSKVADAARAKGLTEISVSDYAGGAFTDGHAPRARRFK